MQPPSGDAVVQCPGTGQGLVLYQPRGDPRARRAARSALRAQLCLPVLVYPRLTSDLNCFPHLNQLSLAKRNRVSLASAAGLHQPVSLQPPQTSPGSHQKSRAPCCFAATRPMLTDGLFSLFCATLQAGRVPPSQPTTPGAPGVPQPFCRT